MAGDGCRGPFEDLLVIDMTHVLSGPFGTQLLCNMDVRVIKVEPLGHGDDTRTFGSYVDGQSFYYSFINHGKESVVLDLKNGHDESIFINMLKQVDVLAENSRPGTMEKLGFSWERLQEINPRLVYVLLSGLGYIGPPKDVPAYDTITQVMSRVMMETGHPDAPPARVGTPLVDLCGGAYLFSGIVSAFYGYEKNQREAHVDITMSDATLSFLGHGLTAYIATGKSPQRLGNRYPHMASFDVSDTQDKPITICCGNDKFFSAPCQVLEFMELINDPRFSSNTSRIHNQAILKEYIERMLKAQVAEVWLARIHEAGVPAAPLLGVAGTTNLS